jgi:hypothetical protein
VIFVPSWHYVFINYISNRFGILQNTFQSSLHYFNLHPGANDRCDSARLRRCHYLHLRPVSRHFHWPGPKVCSFLEFDVHPTTRTAIPEWFVPQANRSGFSFVVSFKPGGHPADNGRTIVMSKQAAATLALGIAGALITVGCFGVFCLSNFQLTGWAFIGFAFGAYTLFALKSIAMQKTSQNVRQEPDRPNF